MRVSSLALQLLTILPVKAGMEIRPGSLGRVPPVGSAGSG